MGTLGPGVSSAVERGTSSWSRVGRLPGFVEFAEELLRCTHPPSVRHEFVEAVDAHTRQTKHHQRLVLIAGRREEEVGLAQEERLLLVLVADEQHRDVGSDDTRHAWLALRKGPDERFAPYPEVEPGARNLHHVR